MDVHAFLFSDMLLLCKNLNKKLDSKVKVIRQPFLIDRLIINDVSSSATAGLACVYLSEFGVAAAAFTLHSPEPKIIKVRSASRVLPMNQSHDPIPGLGSILDTLLEDTEDTAHSCTPSMVYNGHLKC